MSSKPQAATPKGESPQDDAVINVFERINWYQCPVDKDVMKSLLVRSDFQGFKQVFLHLGLIALTGAALVYSWYNLAWYWTVLAVFLHGSFYGFFGGGVAGHELSHRTVFKTRWLNDFFATLSSVMGWGNHEWFRASHIRHHQFTLHQDLDMEVVLPAKLSKMTWVYIITGNPLGILRHIKETFRVASGKIRGEWEHKVLDNNPKAHAARTRQARMNLVVHIVAAAFFVYFHFWVGFLLFTFAPFYAGWIGLLVGFPQHAGLSSNVPDFRLSCRTFECNPFFQFLYWQMNYHIEHHMYAAVPFYNLKKLHHLLKPDMPPAHTAIIPMWRELLQVLKRQKTDPNYVFIPQLPPPAAGRAAAKPSVAADAVPVTA